MGCNAAFIWIFLFEVKHVKWTSIFVFMKKRGEERQFKDRYLCSYSFYSLINWDDIWFGITFPLPPCISFLRESLEIACRNWSKFFVSCQIHICGRLSDYKKTSIRISSCVRYPFINFYLVSISSLWLRNNTNFNSPSLCLFICHVLFEEMSWNLSYAHLCRHSATIWNNEFQNVDFYQKW